MGLDKTIDITAEQRATILALLERHLPKTEAWAYGSRVKWTSRPQSDLDLVVLAKPQQRRQVNALREAFEESNLPFRVDLFVWDEVPEAFRAQIDSDHAVLVADPGACAPSASSASSKVSRVMLSRVIDLRLSSVDKKTSVNEHPISLCNYTDVYHNSFIHGDLDFMDGTATAREIEECTLRVGDVVLTKDSERHDDIGVPALVRETVPDLVCGYHLAILRPNPSRIDGTYMFYALSTADAQQQFHSYANGVTRFGLRKADIGLVDIPLPPLRKQRAIAHILRTLDDKIELNRRINATLGAMARALFRSWFVDFDPVRAKMEGRDTGLPKDIADLFPDRLVDSELGAIPEGWASEPLDSVAHFQNGLALQKFRPAPGDARLPVVKIAQLRTGVADSGEWARANIKPGCTVDDGDVLFSWSGTLLVRVWCGGRAALNQHLFKVTPGRYPKWFYLHHLLSHLLEFREIAKDKATTMDHIRRHHLSHALSTIPPTDLVARISGVFADVLDRQVASDVELRTLVRLRDVLLPKLISGELPVRDATNAVGVVA